MMMDEKALITLEFDKVLARLAKFTAFSASQDLALQLRPVTDIEIARKWQIETSQARLLLDTHDDLSVGGARDVRPAAQAAERRKILESAALMEIKTTLIAARNLARFLENRQQEFPALADWGAQIPPSMGLVDAISRTISERGDVLDSASDKLADIRRDLRHTHQHLLARFQSMVNDVKISPMLQDSLVTQRDGRYVIPLRAEFKGRIKSIVHDQSASGATLFVEPLKMVEENNRHRELQLAERDEERRILSELSRQVGEYAPAIIQTVEVLAAIDLILARAKYALSLEAVEPVFKDWRESTQTPHPGSTVRLWQARHPLLDPQTVVASDVELYPKTYTVVITGPNTGGKTVTLKTVGLLVLMAQSGLHIPAQSGSELSVFEQVYADIGDEQSIEQSLSTFSGHITNIIHILEKADGRSLVIIDELGAGTDPQEGAALARAILQHLIKRGITTFVATHYPELKAFAHATPGVVNASVEFDLETLRPTYHLTVGLPGRSNALAIAQRLGLPGEIVASARGTLNPEDLQADDLIDEITRQRDISRQLRAQAEAAHRQAEKIRADLSARLEGLEEERLQVLETARKQARGEIETLQTEIETIRRELRLARQPLEALQSVEKQVEALEESVAPPPVYQPPQISHSQTLRLGSKVRLRRLGTQGVVTALDESQAEIQVGNLRVRAKIAQLEVIGGDFATSPPPVEKPAPQPVAVHASPGMELDLRGRRVDEALDALDAYLDAAFLAGMPYVRIIHGKGTGRLRQAVRQALREHVQVQTFEAGKDGEGGDGVTVAHLKA